MLTLQTSQLNYHLLLSIKNKQLQNKESYKCCQLFYLKRYKRKAMPFLCLNGKSIIWLYTVFASSLAQLLKFFSEKKLNDYYALISPIQKYALHRQMNQRLKKIQHQRNYTLHNGQLNKQEFFVRKNQLIVLLEKLNEKQPLNSWIWLHIELLISYIEPLNKILYLCLVAEQIFSLENLTKHKNERASIAINLSQRISIFNVAKNHKNPAEKQPVQKEQSLLKSLIVSGIGSFLVWGSYFAFK